MPGTITFNGDDYERYDTIEELRQMVAEGGWDDEADFVRDTGMPLEELVGKWFTIVHSRLFLLSVTRR
jgi:hypothetical protein